MKSLLLWALLFVVQPTLLPAETSYLRGRIIIDGILDEYTDDEWILDSSTSFSERDGDSRWGRDNDIRRIALTWDARHLIVAVDCSVLRTSVMLFLDVTCGGLDDLYHFTPFRRNIDFGGFKPNIILSANRHNRAPEAAVVDCDNHVTFIDTDDFTGVILQVEPGEGALEVALPWELLFATERSDSNLYLPVEGQEISVLALVTGGNATGAGDAAPDPSVRLESDSLRQSVLDNYIRVPLDSDEDRILDIPVSPRDMVSYALSGRSTAETIPELEVTMEKKLFAPDNGDVLRFRISFDSSDYGSPVHITARVYTSSGNLVRAIFEDEPLGPSAVWYEWDGRGTHGDVVPGGVYVLAVNGSADMTVPLKVTKQAVAVIR
jgi:hypothetical protein